MKKKKKLNTIIPRLPSTAIEVLGRGGPSGKTLKPKYERRSKKELLKGEE